MTDFPGIEKRPFGVTRKGEAVDAYVLTNAKGATVTILSFGGTIARVQVPDKHGVLGDVVTGSDDSLAHFEDSPYFGSLVGRVANRIAKGQFELDGQSYQLPINNGLNSLHGGPEGYSRQVWNVEPHHSTHGPSLKLTLEEADGHMGYPGAVQVTVIYTWSDSDVLRLEYKATTDAATPINLTNHVYFNLKDGGKTDIRSHIVRLDADAYTPVDDTLIPIGEIRSVEGTPFDFRHPKPIGAEIDEAGGYDHNFVLKSDNPDFEPEAGYNQNFVLRSPGRLSLAAMVEEPASGRTLECWTDQPGVQFYTGNFLDGTLTGRGGAVYEKQHAFCLETQHFPDSVNHANFPSTILRPGEEFASVTEYRFGTKQD